MREENRRLRQEQIEKAAYEVLRQKGYDGASMLAIAKAANASNQTMYRWYGNKEQLFRRMVDNNAAAIKKTLEETIRSDADPLVCLGGIGVPLLTMLLGEKAVLLNRAAAASNGTMLGKAIAQGGRNAVFPLIRVVIQRAMDGGHIAGPSAEQLAEWFLALLIGDLQIRRVIGVLPCPSQDEIAARAQRSFEAFLVICGR